MRTIPDCVTRPSLATATAPLPPAAPPPLASSPPSPPLWALLSTALDDDVVRWTRPSPPISHRRVSVAYFRFFSQFFSRFSLSTLSACPRGSPDDSAAISRMGEFLRSTRATGEARSHHFDFLGLRNAVTHPRCTPPSNPALWDHLGPHKHVAFDVHDTGKLIVMFRGLF